MYTLPYSKYRNIATNNQEHIILKRRVSNFQYTLYKVTELSLSLIKSIPLSDWELLIGVNKIKALSCEQMIFLALVTLSFFIMYHGSGA